MTGWHRVHRYRVPITGRPVVEMPAGAVPLAVGPPRDGSTDLDLWAIVDLRAPMVDTPLRLMGTGHEVPADVGRYIGTVTTHTGRLVWHVFTANPAVDDAARIDWPATTGGQP